MAESRIRPAFRADEAELGELDRDAWSPLHAVTRRPVPPYEPFFDARHRPEDYLVAEARDGRIAGFVRVAPATDLVCNGHVRQIQGLVVADWARGRGLARALLRSAAAHARGQGARRLYASEGFAVEGVLPGEFLLEGRYVDDVLMGRPL